MDLKPKVTDVNIFTPESACGTAGSPTPTASGCIHPGGWHEHSHSRIAIGGSCGACVAVSGTSNGGPPLSVTAKFDGVTTETRTFYSGYIVLDITNPEADPTVLSAYSSSTLSSTTGYPTVTRMSPSGLQKPIIATPLFPWCSAQACKAMTAERRQERVCLPLSW